MVVLVDRNNMSPLPKRVGFQQSFKHAFQSQSFILNPIDVSYEGYACSCSPLPLGIEPSLPPRVKPSFPCPPTQIFQKFFDMLTMGTTTFIMPRTLNPSTKSNFHMKRLTPFQNRTSVGGIRGLASLFRNGGCVPSLLSLLKAFSANINATFLFLDITPWDGTWWLKRGQSYKLWLHSLPHQQQYKKHCMVVNQFPIEFVLVIFLPTSIRIQEFYRL